MVYGIPTEGSALGPHFGRCPEYTILNVENSEVVSIETVPNPGHHPGVIPQFLKDRNVNVVLAGGMGRKAKDLFSQMQIDVILGCSGSIKQVVNKICKGELADGENLCSPGKARGYGVEKTVCGH